MIAESHTGVYLKHVLVVERYPATKNRPRLNTYFPSTHTNRSTTLEQSLGSTSFTLLMVTLAVGSNLLFLALAFLLSLVMGSGVRSIL